MKMDYPTQIEIDRAVERICDTALPQRESLPRFIRNMNTQLGIKYLFSGIYDVLILSGASFILVVSLFFSYIPRADDPTATLGAALFTFAPFLYMAVFALTLLKEYTNPGLPVKMTCKYTVYHLIAYRMLLFSLISGAVNTVYVLALCLRLDLPPLYFICLSLSALFIFSVLLLFSLYYARSKWPPLLTSVAWMAVNGVLWLACPGGYGALLLRIPLFVWVPAGIACGIVHLHHIKRLTTNRRPRHAFS